MTFPIHDNEPIDELALRYVMLVDNPESYITNRWDPAIRDELLPEVSNLYERIWRRAGHWGGDNLLTNAREIRKMMGLPRVGQDIFRIASRKWAF